MDSCKIILLLQALLVLMSTGTRKSNGEIPESKARKVKIINAYEMAPLLQFPRFVQDPQLPYLDVSGRRFRFGSIGKEKVVVVMTGLSTV
ncbi:hypothetical protein MUK42_35440 [Musa troglodytarum]|uniref:Uncharacterized protein n=1 Tax=Musa troglodytarum TaxID=320322 RepID=A0A9E7KQ98_9LILI|nr:hypothetical protein MUK42_35440 [Musa troglodytarum]